MIAEIAPAKINLYLHVGPLRPDRLHALESLFVFADAGDVLTAEPDAQLSLELTGPFAGVLAREAVEDNLVMRAARILKAATGVKEGARLRLDKRLPIASGIGGGSADAAAALRALVRLWRLDLTPLELQRIAFKLGADVPACLHRRPIYVSGAGEMIAEGPVLPPLWICLANPGAPMPTGLVFAAFDRKNPAPRRPARPRSQGCGYRKVADLVQNSRNDLEPIAIERDSVIQTVVDRLAARPGAIAARMSGSGATVYGLFTSSAAAARAARKMAGRGWWSMSAGVCGADRSPARVVE